MVRMCIREDVTCVVHGNELGVSQIKEQWGYEGS